MNPNPPFPYYSNPSFPPHPPSLNPPYPYPQPQTLPSIANPPPNLLTTLSNLTTLLSQAQTTLTTLQSLLPSPNPTFLPCPYNPSHLMPPESLFKHSLQCPSSPGIINLEVLQTLHYPKSLQSEDQLRKDLTFIQSKDYFFSLENFGENFFYKDCPSVYCSTELDTSKKTFTLPRVLSIHCANFVSKEDDLDSKRFCIDEFGVLPSDILNVRREVEGWSGYPCSYSFLVLRVILGLGLGLGLINDRDMLKWVISNSPRYGVVIDAPMRDHIVLLLRLCLKAIVMEANCSNELFVKGDGKGSNGDRNVGSLSYNCPVLVEVMSWLASQLCVLYGEPNGRFFALNMLKHCILNAAKGLLTFLLEKKMTKSSASKEGFGKSDGSVGHISSEYPVVVGNVKVEEPTDDCERKNSVIIGKMGALIFVSQVAAAIAALHERFLLEEKIKGMRLAMSLSKSQRLAEHSYVTMRAEEARRNRSDYKPILEYDGLLWHRSRNQDLNEKKTREQILAEDRDYKRRRVSYRGKKAKRSTTEVMRDIIEVHMEEINQAGGIGCFGKGSKENEVVPPRPISIDDQKVDRNFKRYMHDSPEQSGEKSHGYRKQVEDQHRRDSHDRYEHIEDKYTISRKEKRDREYRSRSPERHNSDRRSHEKQRERTKSKYDKYDSVSSHTTKHHGSRSSRSVSNSSTDISDRKYNDILETKDYYRERRYGSRRSESVKQSRFEDRYDPSESDTRYDDDSSASKYVKESDRKYKSRE